VTAKLLLVAMVLSLALILGCSLGVPDAALAGEDLEEISGADFTGRVLIPIVDVRGGDSTIITTQIVPDARVVVLEGSLSGSSFTTDSEGRYRIPKLVGDSVRVRVEADGFQTKKRPSIVPIRLFLLVTIGIGIDPEVWGMFRTPRAIS